jgi:hypothetical protein
MHFLFCVSLDRYVYKQSNLVYGLKTMPNKSIKMHKSAPHIELSNCICCCENVNLKQMYASDMIG